MAKFSLHEEMDFKNLIGKFHTTLFAYIAEVENKSDQLKNENTTLESTANQAVEVCISLCFFIHTHTLSL